MRLSDLTTAAVRTTERTERTLRIKTNVQAGGSAYGYLNFGTGYGLARYAAY